MYRSIMSSAYAVDVIAHSVMPPANPPYGLPATMSVTDSNGNSSLSFDSSGNLVGYTDIVGNVYTVDSSGVLTFFVAASNGVGVHMTNIENTINQTMVNINNELSAAGFMSNTEWPSPALTATFAFTGIGSPTNNTVFTFAVNGIVLSSSITFIGSFAFSGCSIPSISIPTGVTSIGANAFEFCASLTSVTLPSSITTIDEYAFQNTGISSLVIPTGATLGQNVFLDCSSLTTLIFLSVYSNASAAIASIPSGVKIYYLQNSSGWSTTATVKPLNVVTNGSLSGLLSNYTAAGGINSSSGQTYYYAFHTGGGGGGGNQPAGGGGNQPTGAACFLGKAPVLTPSGYRRIDSLKVGDLVSTAEGEAVPIQAVFIKSYSPSNTVNPYIIPKGQFGATMNLAISPDHLVQTAAGKMVKARSLGLEQKEMCEDFNYYNIELPTYENMIVAGVTVESKYPTITAELTISQLSKFLEENSEVLTPEVLSQIKMNVTRSANGKLQLTTLRR